MTPQQIEAMKLALEALKLINIEFVCGNGSHHKKEDRHEWDEDCPITNRWRKAIIALEEALAQPEQEPVRDDDFFRMIADRNPKPFLPPQRKPLTHEQRFDVLTKFEPHKHEWHAPAILIDLVEAAHGIKGEA